LEQIDIVFYLKKFEKNHTIQEAKSKVDFISKKSQKLIPAFYQKPSS